MKERTRKVLAVLLSVAMMFTMTAVPVYAGETEVTAVKEMISQLPNSSDVKESDRETILQAQSAYEALTDEEKAEIDKFTGPNAYDTGQPYGRILESALWGLWSLDEVDNTTTLAPGTYDATTTPALTSTYSKGKSTSSRQKAWSVKSVTVDENHKATAVVTVESSSYSGIIFQGKTFNKTNTSGNCEFESIPIDLNNTFYFSGVSTSMPTPIAFSVTTSIEEPEDIPTEPERTDLEITNNTGMFKAVTAYVETAGEGKTLVVALSGSGYHELFKGTYEEAVQNGDNTDNWIHGETNADGKWEFRIPVKAGETLIPLVAISNSYYQKYLNGKNSLERAFYPRQMVLDLENKTIVTDDYNTTYDMTATSSMETFKVAQTITMGVVGGPNSNNYSCSPKLVMADDTYDQVTYPTVVSGALSTATADLDENNTFTISMVNAPNLEAFKDKTPVELTFRVKATGETVTRNMTIDLMARTITFDGEELTPGPSDELTDGTYKASKIATDVTTDASGMIMVTEAEVVIKDGVATAIVTMKGTGADRLYTSETATKDNIVSEAVAEEQKELSGQESALLGGLILEGKSAYTFWPVPIKLGEPKVYAARSASHFAKQDKKPEEYYYVHDFQINEEDLVKVSDSTDIMTPAQEAQRYLNQFFLDGKISTNYTDLIKGKGANVTVPYYDNEEKTITKVSLKRPDTSKFVAGWFFDDSNKSYVTSSNWKKLRYPGCTDIQTNATKRENGFTMTGTLRLYPAGTNYNQYDATGVYYDQAPLAEQTFTINFEKKPVILFDVTVAPTDVKTKEAIDGCTIKVVDESTSEEVTANENGTYSLNNLRTYTISVSKEGYCAQGGAAESVKTGYKPEKEETVKIDLIKVEDSVHTVNFHVVDQLGAEVDASGITVTLNDETVAPNEDGSYTLYDGIRYNYTFKAEGYEDYLYGRFTPSEDMTEEVKVNKYLDEYFVTFRAYDYNTSEVIEDVVKTVTIDGEMIEANEDGTYTVPAGKTVKCVFTKEGYQDAEIESTPQGFEQKYDTSTSMSLTFRNQLIKEVEKAEAQASEIVESEEPLAYPEGTKAALESEINNAKDLLAKEDASEEEFQAELDTLKKAENTAANAQNPDEATITVRLNRAANEPAELMTLNIKGDLSTSLKYKKKSKNKKLVTVLDVLCAVHQEIYGDEFTNDPTKYLEHDDWMDCVVKIFGETTNKTSYTLNNVHIDHMACQKTVLKDGDLVNIKIDKGYRDTYLYFAELEKDVYEKDLTEVLYEGAKISADAEDRPGSGYEIILTDKDGKEVKAVSDEEGKLTFSFEKDGTYTVKSAVKEGTDAVTTPYLKLNVRFEELAAAKDTAEKTVENIADPAEYREAQQAEISEIVEKAKADIEKAETVEETEQIVKDAEAAISEVKTDKELLVEEKEEALKEAEQAKKDAEQAKEEAEKAQAEAEQAKKDAEEAAKITEEKQAELEQAEKDAEKAKEELEQAKKELKTQKLIAGVRGTKVVLNSKKIVKSSKRSVKLTWSKKGSYKVDYYQVQRSYKVSKNYKTIYKTKTATVKTFTNKKLGKGKTYYYRVRGVRTINGKKYFTRWSNVVKRKF